MSNEIAAQTAYVQVAYRHRKSELYFDAATDAREVSDAADG
jgi:hypothetical protein